jgi:hypothetical protein
MVQKPKSKVPPSENLSLIGWLRLLLSLGFATILGGGITYVSSTFEQNRLDQRVSCTIAAEIVQDETLNTRLENLRLGQRADRVISLALKRVHDCLEH